MEKPSIFISSTIQDFQDLRLALKHWLETAGFYVLLSKCNDMEDVPSKKVFDEDFSLIESCNYAIFLIGERAGGYFNFTDKITITRREFDKARDAAKADLKMMVFARQSVWDAKDDLNALTRLVQGKKKPPRPGEEKPEDPAAVEKAAMDAEALEDFLNEAKKDIKPFTTYHDLIELLRKNLNVKHSLKRKALDYYLKQELLINMRELYFAHGGQHHSVHLLLEEARHTVIGTLADSSTLAAKDINAFISFYLNTMRESLSSYYIEMALNSGEYLPPRVEKGPQEGPNLLEALVVLKRSFDSIKQLRQIMADNQTFALLAQGARHPYFTVENTRIAPLVSLYNHVKNAMSHSKAVIRALDGDPALLQSLTALPSDAMQRDGQLTFERPKMKVIQDIVNSNV